MMMLKTLDNAIQVLNCFTAQKKAWGVRELARELNISHTAVNRIVKTYERNGFLTQDAETKKYQLGLKFIEFSQIIRERMSITEDILPIMEKIAEKTKESIFLTWKENNDGVTLAIAESEERIKFSVSIGTRTPLYVGASCKVIMAFLPEEEQLAIIDQGLTRYTEKTTTDKIALLNELKEIKERKWCYTHGEYTDQVFGLAVPLFNKHQQVIASITAAGPQYRLTHKSKGDMLDIIKEGAQEIQQIIYNFF